MPRCRCLRSELISHAKLCTIYIGNNIAVSVNLELKLLRCCSLTCHLSCIALFHAQTKTFLAIWSKMTMFIISRLVTMGSATTRRSRMTRKAKTILTLLTWRTPERRMSRRKSSSKSFVFNTIVSITIIIIVIVIIAPYLMCSNDDENEDDFAAKVCCCGCWATCWRSSPTPPSSSPSPSPTGSASSGLAWSIDHWSSTSSSKYSLSTPRWEQARRWLCSAWARWSEPKDPAQSSSSLGWIDIRFGWISLDIYHQI